MQSPCSFKSLLPHTDLEQASPPRGVGRRRWVMAGLSSSYLSMTQIPSGGHALLPGWLATLPCPSAASRPGSNQLPSVWTEPAGPVPGAPPWVPTPSEYDFDYGLFRRVGPFAILGFYLRTTMRGFTSGGVEIVGFGVLNFYPGA